MNAPGATPVFGKLYRNQCVLSMLQQKPTNARNAQHPLKWVTIGQQMIHEIVQMPVKIE